MILMTDMKVKMNNGRILQFQGILLGEINNHWGETIHEIPEMIEHSFWKEYFLYKTKGNALILYIILHTKQSIEKEKYKVFLSEQELIQYAIKKDDRILFILLDKAEIPIIINIE